MNDAEKPREDVESLLLRSIDGDTEAYGRFYSMKRPRMYRLAARICGPEDAEDVVQAVFLRLWKVLPSISKLYKIDKWLYRATINKSIDMLRHVHQRVRLVLADELDRDGSGVRELMDRGELIRVFDRVAEFLSPRQRTAFVLLEVEGFTSVEAAKYMRVTASTVRNLGMQARRKIRAAIREHYPEYAPRENE